MCVYVFVYLCSGSCVCVYGGVCSRVFVWPYEGSRVLICVCSLLLPCLNVVVAVCVRAHCVLISLCRTFLSNEFLAGATLSACRQGESAIHVSPCCAS